MARLARTVARAGRAVARHLYDLGHRRIAFLASGDMSHRLKPNAPAGFHPRAPSFDHEFIALIRRGSYRELPHIDPEMQELAAEVDAHLDGRWREAQDARREELIRIEAQVDREAVEARDYAYWTNRPPAPRDFVRYQRVDAPQLDVDANEAPPAEEPAAW